jgi:hypothetical protein
LAIVEASGVRLPIALMMVMMVMMVMVVMMMMMTVAHEPRDDYAPTPVVMVVVMMMMMVRDELHSRFPTHSPPVVLLECRQGIGDGV